MTTVSPQKTQTNIPQFEGIIPIDKPRGITAFYLVRILRKLLGVKKIGHAGTLDPFATGVMVMLVGRNYTRLSDRFINQDKEYTGRIHLGVTTDTYDCDGKEVQSSEIIPSLEEVKGIIAKFQGEIEQIPPMFSAKKKNGRKLYELARQGKEVEREPVKVVVETELLDYHFPYIDIRVKCSKGTYIRSIAHDIGSLLGCGGHLTSLTRTRCGTFHLYDCIDREKILSSDLELEEIKPFLFGKDQVSWQHS